MKECSVEDWKSSCALIAPSKRQLTDVRLGKKLGPLFRQQNSWDCSAKTSSHSIKNQQPSNTTLRQIITISEA